MRVFNPSSTPIVIGDALIPSGEHGEVGDSDRVRELIDGGLLVADSDAEPEPETAAPKRGGSK